MTLRRKQSGFTLIELITTMVILGILAYGSVQFILNTSGAYASSQERARLGWVASSTMERIHQEIKRAQADSVHLEPTDPGCLHYLINGLPIRLCHEDDRLLRYDDDHSKAVLLANGVRSPESAFQLVNNPQNQPQWLLVTLDFVGIENHLLLQQEVRLASD